MYFEILADLIPNALSISQQKVMQRRSRETILYNRVFLCKVDQSCHLFISSFKFLFVLFVRFIVIVDDSPVLMNQRVYSTIIFFVSFLFSLGRRWNPQFCQCPTAVGSAPWPHSLRGELDISMYRVYHVICYSDPIRAVLYF